MIKVLCIAGSMGSGGAETFMMKIFRNLDASRIKMDFCVAVDYECLYDREILESGSQIHHITPKTVSATKYKKDLTAVLKKENYDVVLRLGDTCFSFYDLWIAKKCGVKKRAFRSCSSGSSCSKLQMLLHKLLRGIFGQVINIKLAPSTEAARFTFGSRAVKRGKVHILRNGLNFDSFMFSDEGRELVRRQYGIEGKFAVANVGRFHAVKNHKFLLEVFAEISKKREDAVLMLTGEGELENEIRQRADALGLADKVIFTGVRKDIGNVLSAADVFLFTSLFEGMPNTVIEAQANGLFCVISDTITKEADITGRVAYLSLQKSPSEWAEFVLGCDTEHRDTKSDFVRSRYTLQSVVDDFIELIS